MASYPALSRKLKIERALAAVVVAVMLVAAAGVARVHATQQAPSQGAQTQDAQAPASNYNKAMFQPPLPASELSFLSKFDGTPAGVAIKDKQYRKLMGKIIPNCMFHYGKDMPLNDALEMVLKDSNAPVQVLDGRYVMVSGDAGPYLAGRGFMWIDMQDGIAMGGFFFHPTNGEPTPTVAVFSKQVKEKAVKMSELPPAFTENLAEWSAAERIPPITTRYFLTGSNERVLLEHDENYCAPVVASGPADDQCEQMNADAADIDMNAAYYLEQTHHATNATAWMISHDETVWIQMRDSACRVDPDPLGCRIRRTREQVHVIVFGHPEPHPGHK
jgi:hypothetical protein